MTLKRIVPLAMVLALIGSAVATAQHKEPSPESIWQAERQLVSVEDFPARGPILDIGGGGEGVIGQLKGRQVIAIDLIKRELEDAPAGPLLKIVMDARDLKFLDGSFATATVFFTFMYIAPTDHEKVFRELHRVLAPGARLLIWDVALPKLEDKRKAVALYPFTIKLPDREISTGYGVHLPGEKQGLAHFEELAQKTGFTIVSKEAAQQWFFLELSKPAAPSPGGPAAGEKSGDAEIEKITGAIHSCIGWAGTKDFGRLYGVIANDADFLEVHPDGNVVKGFEEFKKAEKFWGSPDFKAVRYDIRDLRIRLSRSGDVAWFFAILDDINEWKGRPANWEDTRWTGVLEKRDGRWVMAQQHFSFAAPK